jgi:hypothetical protein
MPIAKNRAFSSLLSARVCALRRGIYCSNYGNQLNQ